MQNKSLLIICTVLCLIGMQVLLPFCTAIADDALPPCEWGFSGETVYSYESESISASVEQFSYDDARCFLTKIWMQDPGKQITKATARWEKDLRYPSDIAKKLPDIPIIAVNGSGYICKQFPWIPDSYPGKNKSYFNTPLGSLTVTNGEVFRLLEGIPFYGLTLQEDGLHLHVGEDPQDVLAQEPIQTWSFYDQCPLIRDGESILDREWEFANERNIRTIVGKMDNNNYFLLTVTTKTNKGLTLLQCTDFLLENLHPDWVYDLDGGPSSALLVKGSKGKLKTWYGNNSKDTDIMAFMEIKAE